MIRDVEGAALPVEVWDVPSAAFGSFVEGVPGPLAIGTVALEDGSDVTGFVCEGYAVEGARDITDLDGWRNYLARRTSVS
jgi:allophanate hydrolase